MLDYHTKQINALYRLAEEFWPNFYSLDDDMLLMQFCYYAEQKPDRWTEHEWQKRLFMYWHEIDMRCLYHLPEDEPPMGTFEYPWESEAKIPYDLSLPYDAVRPDNMETPAESVANSVLSGSKHSTEGRKGKVGYNNSPDEENLGLYRREIKD